MADLPAAVGMGGVAQRACLQQFNGALLQKKRKKANSGFLLLSCDKLVTRYLVGSPSLIKAEWLGIPPLLPGDDIWKITKRRDGGIRLACPH